MRSKTQIDAGEDAEESWNGWRCQVDVENVRGNVSVTGWDSRRSSCVAILAQAKSGFRHSKHRGQVDGGDGGWFGKLVE